MSREPFEAWRAMARTRSFKLLLVGLLFVLLVLFIYRLRLVFNPLLIGGLMAYILEPMIRNLVARGWSRRLSIFVIYTLMLGLAGIVVTFSTIAFVGQADQLVRSIDEDTWVDSNGDGHWQAGERLLIDHNGNDLYDPGYRGRLRTKATRFAGWWNEKMPSFTIDTADMQEGLKEGLDALLPAPGDNTGWGRRLWELLRGSLGGWVQLAISIFMIPVYAFFLQMLVPPMQRTLPNLVPEAVRDRTFSILKRINRQLSAFFRGKMIVIILKGLLTTLGLQVVGLPFALVIGIIAGALSIVPYLGAIVGFVIAAGIGLLETGGFDLLPWIFLVFFIMEVIEVFLHMIVFGKEVGIHPLAFILALFIGGELLGLFGLIMAVPLVSVLTILYKEFLEPILDELARPEADPEVPSV